MTTDTAPTSTAGDAVLHSDPPRLRPAIWTGPLRAAGPFAAALAVAAFVSLAVLPHVGKYHGNEIADCGIAVMLAVSLTVVNGFTGQFSIGHSGFLSLGGYAAAATVYYGSYKLFGNFDLHGGRLSGGPAGGPWVTRGDGLFLLSLLTGGVVAAAIGWVVGLPSLRLRGDYLAIVTLGFCEIVRVLIQSTGTQLTIDPDVNPTGLSDPADLDPITRTLPQQLTHLGGALGFTTVPAYATVFWIVAAAVLTLVLTVRLKYSAYGRAMLSVREDDIAAQATGVNITRYKVRAFVFASFFAGVAGGLLATKNGTINAGELGFQRSFDYVIMVVLGGLGSVSGAAIAAVLLTLLPEWLRPVADYRMVIYALLLIVIMIVRPQGLLGLREVWDYLPRRWRVWGRGPAGLPLKNGAA
jgi:branched-chain amino acid transport system permease protein